jgi:large subunit ribosomal protein L4
MPAVDIVDAAGKKSGTRDLPAAIFEAPVNVPLMHQVVVAAMAGRRAGTHKVKTRGEVRGGGVKPWRQKGTGRARQGSIRAPQWTGGGIVHGPVVRTHNQRINKKMVKGALRSALSDAATSGKLIALKELAFDEPKTKQAAEMLSALDCDGRVLLVLDRPTDDGAAEKSFRNLQQVRIVYAGGIGTYDVLLADQIVITADALDALEGSTNGTTEAKPAQPRAQAKNEAKPEPEPEAEAEPEPEAEDKDTAGDTDGGDDA